MNKSNERFICKVCGGYYTRTNKTKHLKSNKHKLMVKINKLINTYQK